MEIFNNYKKFNSCSLMVKLSSSKRMLRVRVPLAVNRKTYSYTKYFYKKIFLYKIFYIKSIMKYPFYVKDFI